MVARVLSVTLSALMACGGGLLFAWIALNAVMGCGEPGGYCWPFEWWR